MSRGERLRWGILGTASIAASAFVPGVRRSSNGEIVGIASRNSAKADAFAADHVIPHVYGSYEGLLDSPHIDAVYVPLPNSMHAEWSIRAARAGKHVLCEKPLAANTEEAQEMVGACKAAGVVLMEAFMYRFHPQHERLLRAIQEGLIGTVRLIDAAFTFNLTERPHIAADPALAGGSLMDVGCYAVNACRMITGTEPIGVTAQHWVNPASGCEESIAATLRFPGDVLASIHSAFCVTERQTYTVYGDEGFVRTDHAYAPETDVDIAVEIHSGQRHERVMIERCDQYQLEVEEFGDAALHDKPLRWPAEDGVRNMRVIDAIYEAAREGIRVSL